MEVSKAIELIKRESYSVLAADLVGPAPVYPLITAVQPISMDGSSGFGTKFTTITEMGELVEVKPGEAYPEDTFESAWSRYCRFIKFARRLKFTEEDYNAINAAGKMGDIIALKMNEWRQVWAQQRDALVADLFNGGAAAGTVFDGTFKGEVDPYPTKVYDNKNFFATDHPLAAGSGTTIGNLRTTADLDLAELQAAEVAFQNDMGVSERGFKLVNTPSLLITPVGLKHTAKKLVDSAFDPEGATSAINTMAGQLQNVTWRHLTNNSTWYLARAGSGIRCFDSGDPRPLVWWDEDTKSVILDVDAHFGRCVENIRGLQQNVGS